MFFLPLAYCLSLSLLTGPVGSLILWSRLTFFGETLAHASIFGIFLSLFFDIPLSVAMVCLVLLYCLLIELFIEKKLDQSYLLPLFSYGLLGLGFVLLETMFPNPSLIFNVLLGDLLLVTTEDVLFLTVITALIWGLWKKYHRYVLMALLMPELAELKQLPVKKIHFTLNVVAGLAIAFLIQAAGMLLSMALLTIPPLTAKILARSPNQMIKITCLLSFLSIFTGFFAGYHFDVSLGAMMSTSCLIYFVLINLALKVFKKSKTNADISYKH